MKESTVNLQMIADRVGVSRATACRALKNHSRISAATIQRVKEVAEELGYQRDARLSGLMVHLRHRKKSMDRPVIALLINQSLPFDRVQFGGRDTVVGGAWARLEECGYQPEIFNIHEAQNEGRSLDRILWSRGIQGVIVCPFQVPGPLPALEWKNFSVVAIGHSIHSHRVHRAVTNQYQGMLDCIARLHTAGYRKIGAVLRQNIDQRTHGFYHAAYLLKQDYLGRSALAPFLYCDSISSPKFISSFGKWFARHRPDAIICGGFGILDCIYQQLKAQGISIPKELGLADLQLRADDTFASGISQNSSLVGSAAVDLLMPFLQNNEKGLPAVSRIVLVEGEWIEAKTTRRAKT